MILWSLWFIQNLWAISCNDLANLRSSVEAQEVQDAQKYVRSQQHRPAPLVAGIAVMVREMMDRGNFLPLDESVREMELVRHSLKTTLESLREVDAQKMRIRWEEPSDGRDFGGFESLRVLNTSSRRNIFSTKAVPGLLVEEKNWTPRASVELYERTSMINPTDRIWVFRRKIRADEALDLADHINDQAHQLDYQRIQILNLEEKALLRGGKSAVDTLLVGASAGGASLLSLGMGSPEVVPLFSGLFFWYVAVQRTFFKAMENMHNQRSILNQLVQAPLTQVSHVHIRIGGIRPYIESLRDGQLAAQDLREQFWMAHAHGDMALDKVVKEGRGMSLGEYFQKLSPDPLHPEAAVEGVDFHSYIRREGHEIIWTLALQIEDLRFDQIKPPKSPRKKRQIEIKEPRASWEPGLVPIPVRN